MSKFGVFDENGLPLAFFSEDLHGCRRLLTYDDQGNIISDQPNPDCIIPEDAVEIRDSQWQELINHPGYRRWNGSSVEPYLPPVSSLDVNAERQRRLLAGKVINGVHVTGDDARNLTNLALASQMRISAGDTSTITVFRDGWNIDHELSPPQIMSLWQQSSEYVSALYAASWALKALDPIPSDFDDDRRWPKA